MKVEKENWNEKVTYEIANGWNALSGQTDVYYREVEATTAKAGVSYYILKGNTTYANGVVTVSENLTKAEVNSIATQPKLIFTAYAVQKDGIDTAADAWAKIPATTTTNP